MLIAVVAYAGYTVSLRWKPMIDWRTLMAIPALTALVTTFPLVLWEHARDATIWPDPRGWAIILYTALFPSLLAQIFYIKGVEGIGPNRAGLFINIIPVFGTILSVLVIGAHLQVFHAARSEERRGGKECVGTCRSGWSLYS